MMAAPTPLPLPTPPARGDFAPGLTTAAEAATTAAGQPFEDLLDDETGQPRRQDLPDFIQGLALGLTHSRHPAALGLAMAPGQNPLEATPEEMSGEGLVEGNGEEEGDLLTSPNLVPKASAKGEANAAVVSPVGAKAGEAEGQTTQSDKSETGRGAQSPVQTPAQSQAPSPASPSDPTVQAAPSSEETAAGKAAAAAILEETAETQAANSAAANKAEPKPELRADAKADPKGEIRADAKADAKVDSKADSKTDAGNPTRAFSTGSESPSQEEGQPDLSGRQRAPENPDGASPTASASRSASAQSDAPPEFAPARGIRREEIPAVASLSREERPIEAPRPIAPNTTPAETAPAPNTASAANNVRPVTSTQATPYTDPTQFLQRIEDAAQALRTGNPSRVDLDVSLNENQSVRVRLEMRAGELITTIRSDSRELREMLERAWPEFSARNAERGLRMGEALFQNSDQGQSQNRSQGDNSPGNRQSSQDSAAGDSNGQFGEQANPRTLGRNGRGGAGGPARVAPTAVPTVPEANPTDPNKKVTLWA